MLFDMQSTAVTEKIFERFDTIIIGAGAAGITTNIILQPYGQAALASTTAKVGSGTTLTLSGTHDEVDFVSFLVRSGSASTTVYATANKTFKY